MAAKKLEKLTKKQLKNLRLKADAYDRVCKFVGVKNDLIGFFKRNHYYFNSDD